MAGPPTPGWAAMSERSYFDAASAAPLHPAAREALLAALDEGWADPARLHREGRQARLLLDSARESVAEVLAVGRDDVVFTPNGTVSAHLAVRGGVDGRRRVGQHVVHSAIEHSAVLMATAGHDTTAVPVDRCGLVDVEAYAAALRADTALACLISASHEVGTVQPVAAVAERCAQAGVPLYVDASQSVGRGPVPQGWAILSASAHKWGGPPGVGLLVLRPGTRFAPSWPSDERERGVAAGAPDLPALIAAAVSLRAAAGEAADEDARLRPLVDLIRTEVARTVPDVEVVGHPLLRLPHLVTFSCLYVPGEQLVAALDRAGFAVSSGSSCTSSTLEPSHVLAAMGVLTHGNVRISLHKGTGRSEVLRLLALLPELVSALRTELGAEGLAGS